MTQLNALLVCLLPYECIDFFYSLKGSSCGYIFDLCSCESSLVFKAMSHFLASNIGSISEWWKSL